jgi:hypothetical protein
VLNGVVLHNILRGKTYFLPVFCDSFAVRWMEHIDGFATVKNNGARGCAQLVWGNGRFGEFHG